MDILENILERISQTQETRDGFLKQAEVEDGKISKLETLYYALEDETTAELLRDCVIGIAAQAGVAPRSPPPRPQVRTTRAADICQTPQYRILTLAIKLEVFLFLDADADDICVRADRIPEAVPLNIFEPHAAMNEHFLWRLADSLRIRCDRHLAELSCGIVAQVEIASFIVVPGPKRPLKDNSIA
jgi:hypothetical protein